MRISLLHNPTAGNGVSFDEVNRVLGRAGYEIAREITKTSDFERVLEETVSFVVAAGGDGTVRKAVRALAGSGVPLAVIPLGTANNIARSLGVEGSLAEVVESWKSARRVPFDVGLARGQWGDSRFVEGVGSGLVPAGIAAAQEHPQEGKEDVSTALERAVRTYAETLSRLQPRRWTGIVDGSPIDGEFLLVEILNIRSVGANLVLAPNADPSDGLFDVVTAGEAERGELADYLAARQTDEERTLSLPTRRVSRVEIRGWEQMHVDDEVRKIVEAGTVTVELEPGAVEFLV